MNSLNKIDQEIQELAEKISTSTSSDELFFIDFKLNYLNQLKEIYINLMDQYLHNPESLKLNVKNNCDWCGTDQEVKVRFAVNESQIIIEYICDTCFTNKNNGKPAGLTYDRFNTLI